MIGQEYDLLVGVAMIAVIVSVLAVMACVMLLQRSRSEAIYVKLEVVRFVRNITGDREDGAAKKPGYEPEPA